MGAALLNCSQQATKVGATTHGGIGDPGLYASLGGGKRSPSFRRLRERWPPGQNHLQTTPTGSGTRTWRSPRRSSRMPSNGCGWATKPPVRTASPGRFGPGLAAHGGSYEVKRCLKEGVFLPVWRRAKLVLLRKGNKPADTPSGYRPICLLDEEAKLFERIIVRRLVRPGGGRTRPIRASIWIPPGQEHS